MKRYFLRGKKGQSLVETALVLPIILILLMGIIDFGMMFNNYILISNAARDGARNAATGLSDSGIEELVDEAASNLDPSRLTVTVSPDETDRDKGDEVVVTVGYDYDMLTPVIEALLPGPVHLTAKSVMRME